MIHRKLNPKDNRGSSPIPSDAINSGDGLYNEKNASDKNGMRRKMDKNMEKTKNNSSGDANQFDDLSKAADKERTRKPGSQSNSSGRANNGRGGGK